MIILDEYVRFGEFLHTHSNEIDCVILDTPPSHELQQAIDTLGLPVFLVSDVWYEIGDDLLSIINAHDRVCIVCEYLTSVDYLPILDDIDSACVILQLFSWIFGLGHKMHLAHDDISQFLESERAVREAFSLKSFDFLFQSTFQKQHTSLDQWDMTPTSDPKIQSQKIIRLTGTELPLSLVEQAQDRVLTELAPLIQLTQDDNPVNYTLVCSWSFLIEAVKAAQLLSKTIPIDIFCLTQRNNIQLDKSFVNHIRHTKHMILVIDQTDTQDIIEYRDELLQDVFYEDKESFPSITIDTICPHYNSMTTILPEYIVQESKMDWASIAEYIQKI